MIEHDDPDGDMLARALAAEADSIVPAGDGLSRIRERVEQRQRRLRWLRPTLSAAAAAVVAVVVFGSYVLAGGTDRLRQTNPPVGGGSTPAATSVSPGPTSASTRPASSAPASTQASSAPPTRALPFVALYPFTDASQVTAWQHSSGPSRQAWMLDPTKVAEHFVRYVGIHDTLVATYRAGDPTSGEVELQTTSGANHQPRAFTTVLVSHAGTAGNDPWIVTGAVAPYTTVLSPHPGATVGTPLTVRLSSSAGVEESYLTTAWTATSGQPLDGAVKIVVGQGTQQGTLHLPPSSGPGFVLAVDAYDASGVSSTGRLAAVPVTFSRAAAPLHPVQYVAEQKGRIGVFSSSDGSLVRWLTDSGDGVDAAPTLDPSGQWVYYLRGTTMVKGIGVPAGALWKVPIDGKSPAQPVLDNAGPITAYSVSGDHDQYLAYVVTENAQQTVTWKNTDNGSGASFTTGSVPPEVEQLAWAPDHQHIAAQVRGGMQWGLTVYSTANFHLNSGTAVPCNPSGCAGPSYDAAGNLYYLQPKGQQLELVQWTGKQVKHVSTIPGTNPERATVAFTKDAEAALVDMPGTGGPASDIVYFVENGVATQLATGQDHPSW